MTVTGAVTAELRPTGVYVPPFQWGAAEVPFVITTGGPSREYIDPSALPKSVCLVTDFAATGGSSLDPNPNVNRTAMSIMSTDHLSSTRPCPPLEQVQQTMPQRIYKHI